MKWLPFFSIIVMMISCGASIKKDVNSEIDGCLQESYNVYKGNYPSYTEWKMAYMDQITFCIHDSNTILKLARMDSENEDYTFFVYGMMERTEPFETIYKKYPISFHCPGCTSSEMGELYNREMKRYLKKNEGLDYDSVYHAENKKYKNEQEN